jgi:hypothetical protein
MSSSSYFCANCGKEHAGLPTDWGFRLPDEVHALSYIERYERTRHNKDLCCLDRSRYFLRGVVLLPFTESDGDFAWGMWAEVSHAAHDLYMSGFEEDLSALARETGTLANSIPGYPETTGVQVEVQFQGAGDRPLFWLPSHTHHALAHEQRGGVSSKRHHDILAALGHFSADA